MLSTLEQHALVVRTAEILRNHGSWAGETHVQKSLFFLQQLLGVPLDYRFTLYKYGPYSFDLRDDLGRMRAYGFLQLESRPPYGPSYIPGRLGEKLLNHCGAAIARYVPQVNFIADSLNTADSRQLERFATALFVGIEHPNYSQRELVEKIISLKPHINSGQALEALGFVDRLKQDTIRKGYSSGGSATEQSD